MTKHGNIVWQELITSDVEGAKEFYSKVFGWEFQTLNDNPDMKYTTITTANSSEPFAGAFDRKNASVQDLPPHWGQYIEVDNIEESIKEIVNLNGQVLVPITYAPNCGKFAVVTDPQGAAFNIIESEACTTK